MVLGTGDFGAGNKPGGKCMNRIHMELKQTIYDYRGILLDD